MKKRFPLQERYIASLGILDSVADQDLTIDRSSIANVVQGCQIFPKLMAKTSTKMTILAIIIKVQHFQYVKKLFVEKYAKPKLFMPTTSKKYASWQH